MAVDARQIGCASRGLRSWQTVVEIHPDLAKMLSSALASKPPMFGQVAEQISHRCHCLRQRVQVEMKQRSVEVAALTDDSRNRGRNG